MFAILSLGKGKGHKKYIKPPSLSEVETSALRNGFDEKITFSNGLTKFYKFLPRPNISWAGGWSYDRECGNHQGVLPIIHSIQDAELLRLVSIPSRGICYKNHVQRIHMVFNFSH